MNACVNCGCSVVRRGRRGPAPKWCPVCSRRTGRRGQVTKDCRVCGRSFTGPRRQPTCGRTCGKRRSRLLVKCERCRAGMLLQPYLVRSRRFCSVLCANRAAGDGRVKVWSAKCRRCRRTFRPKKPDRRAYCSRDCSFATKRGRRLRRRGGEAGRRAKPRAASGERSEPTNQRTNASSREVETWCN